MSSMKNLLPTLRFHKDIWQNFPVVLIPLVPTQSGYERHAIVWNRKRLNEWRLKHHPTEWLEHEVVQTTRLLGALCNSKQWVLETPTHEKHICIIRTETSEEDEEPLIRVPTPVLTCLNDIKAFYPVVWHEIANTDGNKVYSIELYDKVLKTMPLLERANLCDCLYTSLKASTAWKVLPSVLPGEFCRIQFGV